MTAGALPAFGAGDASSGYIAKVSTVSRTGSYVVASKWPVERLVNYTEAFVQASRVSGIDASLTPEGGGTYFFEMKSGATFASGKSQRLLLLWLEWLGLSKRESIDGWLWLEAPSILQYVKPDTLTRILNKTEGVWRALRQQAQGPKRRCRRMLDAALRRLLASLDYLNPVPRRTDQLNI